ncbi:alpha/beta fold hydrolase [Poseidonocella sp. HB161398]|uniref:alpha/beta fold hydrolase n=1 Tax=Poseidonocella sp. HB161398 TaxID=2320855 RepID=UPI00110963BC|nr:alpha/beta fold hydrolase [Poseidonocella sp. HB161398]
MLPPLERLELGDLPLSGGGVLPGAVLTYRVWGRPAGSGGAVLVPSHYTGTSASPAGMIGPGRALDPERLCIIAADMFGNGNASSPSHRSGPAARLAFPRVSIADNVAAQARLLSHLGIARLRLVYGWSMGAIQAWHWAALHPDQVDAILPVCGATGCWPLNGVFLDGLRTVLRADPAFREGLARPEAALRAFARVYAGWAYSDAFWRDRLWQGLGFASAEALLQWWEEDHLAWDALDLAAVLETWAAADPAALAPHLPGIRARVIAMPCDTDRYFTLAENRLETAALPGAELRPLRSDLGHVAGAPGRHAAETARIEAAIAELLAPPPG